VTKVNKISTSGTGLTYNNGSYSYRPNRRVIDEFTFPCILAYLPDYHSITAYHMYYVGPSVCRTLFARHYAVVWYTYWQWHYWHIVRSRVYETVGCPSVRLCVASFSAAARFLLADIKCCSIAALPALSSNCGQGHVVSWRRKLNTGQTC